MSEKPIPPKGTRDFYPEDMAVQNRIFGAWRETARLFGFEEFEGPIFEHLDLFTRKSGAEIVKQLYHFKDKSERDLALRPAEFVMVGNSLRSDILPAVELGARAVFIPHALTWSHEHVPAEHLPARGWIEIASMGELPKAIKAMEAE